VFIWKDDSEPSPVKNQQSSIMLEITHQDEYEVFSYVRILVNAMILFRIWMQ
jgi:hypothetical protein